MYITQQTVGFFSKVSDYDFAYFSGPGLYMLEFEKCRSWAGLAGLMSRGFGPTFTQGLRWLSEKCPNDYGIFANTVALYRTTVETC